VHVLIITCDVEIKELYECHCCLRLVCLYHLNEHVQIEKNNKRPLDSFNALNTIVNALKQIVEQKLLMIEREQNLIVEVKKVLDLPSNSIDAIQNIFEKIKQTIKPNRSEEVMVKVEQSLSPTRNCSCVCKCNTENMNSNDVAYQSGISKDDEYSTDISYDFIDLVSSDETEESIQDQHVNEEEGKKRKRKSVRGIVNKCSLTFNGAYGFTKANHSIEFLYAQRLVRAAADNQDSRITKLCDGNENVLNPCSKVPCPFSSGRINLSEYTRENVVNVPGQRRLVPLNIFKGHLQFHHKISNSLAQKSVDDF
ncbi:unnamed protein product, partial [Rotaria sp. Silwood2]